LIVTESLAVPPLPVHVRVKVVAAASAPVDWLPLVALLPLHPPEAVQAVALVELQVRVEAAPLVTVVGFALNDTVGAGGGAPTVTVTVWLAVPPAPVQFSVKLVVAASAPVD